MLEKVTLAVPTAARDNRGALHRVTVSCGGVTPWRTINPETQQLEQRPDNAWRLAIEGTPGRWYMKDLLSGGWPLTMSIDAGQQWTCTNFGEVLRAAMIVICTAES